MPSVFPGRLISHKAMDEAHVRTRRALPQAVSYLTHSAGIAAWIRTPAPRSCWKRRCPERGIPRTCCDGLPGFKRQTEPCGAPEVRITTDLHKMQAIG